MNIKKWNARLSLLTVVLFLIHEGYQLYAYTAMYYNPVLSKVTVLQRVSAVLIVLLLPLHIFSFGILKSSVGGVGYILTEIAQILFYAALCCHISLSFSNALVTLGYLADMRKKRVIDIVVTIICVILFIAASVIITSAHTMIFKG